MGPVAQAAFEIILVVLLLGVLVAVAIGALVLTKKGAKLAIGATFRGAGRLKARHAAAKAPAPAPPIIQALKPPSPTPRPGGAEEVQVEIVSEPIPLPAPISNPPLAPLTQPRPQAGRPATVPPMQPRPAGPTTPPSPRPKWCARCGASLKGPFCGNCRFKNW